MSLNLSLFFIKFFCCKTIEFIHSGFKSTYTLGKYFLPVCLLLIFLTVFQITFFSLIICAPNVLPKNSSLNLRPTKFSLGFFTEILYFYALHLRSIIHFEWIFVYSSIYESRLIIFSYGCPKFQHHFWKKHLSPTNYLNTFVKNRLTTYVWICVPLI